MKNLKEQSPIVLAFAIIGVCAMIYFIFLAYQHYVAEQQRAILLGPPSGAVGQALKATPQPPPQ
jgi:hypothetical protein